MKKISFIFTVFLLAGISAFTQPNDACVKATEEGKAFEAEGKWVHAAAKYYDAMEADPSEAEFALNRYKSIITSFKSGNPGPGEYDDFSLYTGWVEITKEAEDYFNENMIGNIYSYIVKGNPDYDSMTYSYDLYMSVVPSEKFRDIVLCLKQGLDSKYNANWKKIPRYWPVFSVYGVDSADKRALVVVDTPEAKPNAAQFCGITNVIEARSELEYSKKTAVPSWIFPSQHIDATKNIWDGITCAGCYRVEYDIVDLNGNIITTGGPVNIMTVQNNAWSIFLKSGKNQIKGISASDAKKIDQNQYKIVYKKVWIASGLLKGKNLVTGKTDVKAAKNRLIQDGTSRDAVELMFANQKDTDVITVSFDLSFSKLFPINIESVKSSISVDGMYKAPDSVYQKSRIAVENKKKADEEAKRKAEQARIEEEKRLAEEARKAEEARIAEEKRLAEETRLKAEEDRRKAEEERIRAEKEKRDAEILKEPVLAAELYFIQNTDSETSVTKIERIEYEGTSSVRFFGNTGNVNTDWGYYEAICKNEIAVTPFKSASSISFSVLGDGNTYLFSLYIGEAVYSCEFKTKKDKVTEVVIPFSKLKYETWSPKEKFDVSKIAGFKFKLLNKNSTPRYNSNKDFSITIFNCKVE